MPLTVTRTSGHFPNACATAPVKPTFTQSEAVVYFPTKYSTATKLDTGHLNWFPYIPVQNDVNFDISPITPKLVKSVLFKKKSTSAPGPGPCCTQIKNQT